MTTKRTPRKPTAKQVGINVALPAELHRALRIEQIRQGRTLAEAVTAAITQWVTK